MSNPTDAVLLKDVDAKFESVVSGFESKIENALDIANSVIDEICEKVVDKAAEKVSDVVENSSVLKATETDKVKIRCFFKALKVDFSDKIRVQFYFCHKMVP